MAQIGYYADMHILVGHCEKTEFEQEHIILDMKLRRHGNVVTICTVCFNSKEKLCMFPRNARFSEQRQYFPKSLTEWSM
jgi:hypothetical protein